MEMAIQWEIEILEKIFVKLHFLVAHFRMFFSAV